MDDQHRMDEEKRMDDRFAEMAGNYDRWIGWEPRLAKEMPFLLSSLPPGAILDVGCGTGAHSLALAASGYSVTGLDQSASMLEKAREAERLRRASDSEPMGGPKPVEWLQGDITEPGPLTGRKFRGVIAIGNALLSIGEENRVLSGLQSMIETLAEGGTLILQYLNATRIHEQGRLVVKGGPEIWLRHHFEAGGEIRFHSYVIHPTEEGEWGVDYRSEILADLPPERILPLLRPHFAVVETFDGLTGRPFSPSESDALGVRASGKH